MLRKSPQYLLTKNHHCGDRLHQYNNIIVSTLPPHRLFMISKCRCKKPDLNAHNYYDLLGVERTATPQDIRKAFVKLSKQYHPDSNSSDKSLHEKFVRINEAFSILSKQSTRNTYDQTLNSSSSFSYQSHPRHYSYSSPSSRQQTPFNWSHTTFGSRSAYQNRWNTNESNWGTPHFDKTYFDMLRRRMEQDRRRTNDYSYNRSAAFDMMDTYFAPFSLIAFVIVFGVLIHALQWRIARYADPLFPGGTQNRNYHHAYREWRRLSLLDNTESLTSRDSSRRRNSEQ